MIEMRKPKENIQHTIVRPDTNQQAEWDGQIILFDTEEEVNEFITNYPKFFVGVEYVIESGIYFIDNSINYKDIPQEAKIEELEVQKL